MAHNITIEFFSNKNPGLWEVNPNPLKDLPTAWKIEFSHTPSDSPTDEPLPTVGFLSEMDALEGCGHCCGHHLIYLQGLYAAQLTRQALIDYDIPGHVVLWGTPDEEEASGSHDMLLDRAFDDSQVWLMSHPTIANAMQPMSSRQNIVTKIIKDTHFEAVKDAYNILVSVKNLAFSGKLPGTNSTAALVEDTGMFVCNVVQADIQLGVVGPSLGAVNDAISSIKASNAGYAQTNFTVAESTDVQGGIDISFVGNAGHTASNNLGALDLSIDAFAALNASGSNLQVYLPHNLTFSELDFTVDCRTRWTDELQDLVNAVLAVIPTQNFTLDTIYPALEVDLFLAALFVDTIADPHYGVPDWPITPLAPAATDKSWVQQAVVSNVNGNHTLQSVAKAVMHSNYNICNQTVCAFNHEPGFLPLSGTDFAFQQTEIVARATAQIAVELLNDPNMMADATKNIRAGPNRKL
ncbi:MAG: hypothetical protein M1820_008318 [Bogoriella megaspora]|nr:MAG: hypothetical protein M1820_008318 [Bogoriella megaspora]